MPPTSSANLSNPLNSQTLAIYSRCWKSLDEIINILSTGQTLLEEEQEKKEISFIGFIIKN